MPNWIGDAVLALPALAALIDAHPERAVVVASRGVVAPLFAGLAGVTRVVEVAGRGRARYTAIARALGGERPALAIVMPHSTGAALETWRARPRAAWGYGGVLRRFALDIALPRRWLAGRHRWEAYALLAAAVTGRPVAEQYPVAIGTADRAAAEALYAAGGPAEARRLVGLFPGSNASSRRWPAERFAALASRLGADGARVILFGGPGDQPLTAAIAAAARPAPLDWAGRTPLLTLAACFQRLDLLVTNDTGPMHLAAAVGTPILDLCGAADARVTGPRGTASRVLVHPIHCRPCVKNTCAYNLGCMRGLAVERVRSEAQAALRPRS
ncbi:MAG: glycosyltransferase family 9 protein [Gemmatimonadota bacterium]